MTPYQLLQWAVLKKAVELNGTDLPEVTLDNLEPLWEELRENDDSYHDAMGEVRCSGEETGLPCPYSRHYEAKAVAAQMPNGQWVGWTYWYGGGKHGEPGEVDWMEDAYFVNLAEEEKLVVVRTFTKEPTTC